MKALKQRIKLSMFFTKKAFALLFVILFLSPGIIFARVPNDPFAEQWSFADTKVYQAWDKATGSREVVVAIIDNGFDTFHPDIYPNVWKNEDEIADNKIDDDKNGYIDDVWGWDFSAYDADHNGIFTDEEMSGNNDPRPWIVGREEVNDDIHHGTLVAGIVGSVGNNNKDGAGVNWQARLMNLKVIEVSGVGDLTPLVRAIYYAVDNGADVINISLVGDVDGAVKEAVKYAYDNGVAVIAAAGNDTVELNLSPAYPVCADAGENEQWILGVSAIGKEHFLAPFSNIGASCVDITSPGVAISSTMRYAPRYGLKEMYGGGWQGTSFAAPIVSGAAALIKAIQPSWGPKQIYEAIISTVHRTPPDDPAAYKEIYGAGLVQVGNAVDYALSRIVTGHPLLSFLAINFVDGAVRQNQLEPEKIEASLRVEVKGVDDIVRYEKGFITVKQVNKNLSAVSFYNNDWKITGRWQVKSDGKLRAAAGDVFGDDNPEIILAPAYESRQVMRVYDLAGKELKKFEIGAEHNGVSLGLIDVKNNKKEILAVYRYNNMVKLYHFDRDLTIVRSVDLPFIKNTGAATAGDIDGDGRQEYIVGAGVGDIPFVAYYNIDGSLKRKFYAYDTNYLNGLEIAVGDYDNDGKDDVLVGARLNGGLVRVWNNRSKKIGEWIFGQTGTLKLLPVYK